MTPIQLSTIHVEAQLQEIEAHIVAVREALATIQAAAKAMTDGIGQIAQGAPLAPAAVEAKASRKGARK